MQRPRPGDGCFLSGKRVLCHHSTQSTDGTVSAPLSAIAIIIIMVAMPTNFGLDQHTPSFRTRASYRSLANLDFRGSILITAGTFLIVTVLNETNLAFSWSSGSAIALLLVAIAIWIAFFGWEYYISGIPGKDPIFPKRWLFDRSWIGLLLWVHIASIIRRL